MRVRTFADICGILAAFADILQNPNIFTGVLATLLLLGGLGAVFSVPLIANAVPETWVSDELLNKVGIDPPIKKALLPFSFSYLILAAGILAFSEMSAQASKDGGEGALAKVFPILQDVRVALGRIGQDVGEVKQHAVAIKQDTEQLVETAVKWISIDVSLNSSSVTTDAGEKHYAPDGSKHSFQRSLKYCPRTATSIISSTTARLREDHGLPDGQATRP